MDDAKEILELERRFWTGDAAFYERKLARTVMMLFPPPVGVLDRGAVVQGLAGAPRWREIEIEAPQLVELAPGVLALGYRAAARRTGAPVYRALAGSVYVRQEAEWRLAFHQQNPLPGRQEEQP